MNKHFLTIAIAISCIATINAQTKFEVPKNVELKTNADYKKYETAMIDAAKWLEETDLNSETEKRKNVNAFVLQWISGSPTITVSLNEQLSQIYGKNAHLLGIYLASYTRNFLESPETATKFSATKAGLIAMMNVYKKGIGIKKSKEMEKLIGLTDENKLDEFIQEKFK